MRPRKKVVPTTGDDAPVLPLELTRRATSAEDDHLLHEAKRRWYRERGINPDDWPATRKVWQETGRAYGVLLSTLDRTWAWAWALVWTSGSASTATQRRRLGTVPKNCDLPRNKALPRSVLHAVGRG